MKGFVQPEQGYGDLSICLVGFTLCRFVSESLSSRTKVMEIRITVLVQRDQIYGD